MLLYKGTPCGGIKTQNFGGDLMCSEHLSPSLPCASSPLSLSCGSSKGCVGANINSTTARRRATAILDLIQTDLLVQSQLDQRSRRSSSFTVCVWVLWGAATCGTKSLRQCCRTGVVASGSTRPWGRLRWLHHQRLCGSVVPAFGLRGYVTESLANRYNITNR
jgi:hypothetical protein